MVYRLKKSCIEAIPRSEAKRIQDRINQVLIQQHRIMQQPHVIDQARYFAPLVLCGMMVGDLRDGKNFITICVASYGEPSQQTIDALRRSLWRNKPGNGS